MSGICAGMAGGLELPKVNYGFESTFFPKFFPASGSRRKQTRTLDRRKIGLAIYGLIVCVIVFCGNYFGDRIEPLIRAELAKQQIAIINVKTIEPTLFPPRLFLENIDVRDPKSRKPLLQAGSASLVFDFKSLLKLRLGLNFEIHAYGADFKGLAGTGMFFNPSRMMLKADCINIDLNRIPEIRNLNIGLKGNGEIHFNMDGNPSVPSSLTGELDALLEKPSFNGIKPLFRAATVSADDMKLKAVLSNSVLEVQQLALNGKALSGELAGTITLEPADILKSRLDLKGQMKADLNLFDQRAIVQKNAIALMKAKKAIPVEISDTIGAPWVSLAK